MYLLFHRNEDLFYYLNINIAMTLKMITVIHCNCIRLKIKKGVLHYPGYLKEKHTFIINRSLPGQGRIWFGR